MPRKRLLLSKSYSSSHPVKGEAEIAKQIKVISDLLHHELFGVREELEVTFTWSFTIKEEVPSSKTAKKALPSG